MSTDSSQRFIFENRDIRGQLVHLNGSFEEMLTIHAYPEAVAQLLGEFLAASVLLSSTLKFEGRLILQVRSKGEVSLIMAETTHDGQVRAIARVESEVNSGDFGVLLKDATLVVSVEPKNGERYQSLVPLLGANLGECLGHYFDQSEQLSTFIKLATNEDVAAGVLIQQLPRQLVEDPALREDQWQHAVILAKTLKKEELLDLDNEQLLRRLYVEDEIKLLEAKSLVFKCSCNYERTARALMMVEADELDEMFTETPTLEMLCEFCQKKYHFTRESLGEVLSHNTTRH
jgi:molecular chaperone Hsp33